MPPEGYEEEQAIRAFVGALVAACGRERVAEWIDAMRSALSREDGQTHG